ncbi:hypothetical protein Back2_18230 [Nocardioides baekrokdamisoli]|uniref:Uncharacterized protein n=1 Tax=Nocardioides baekrokdamisoli TaxID=1804624 RepID=A0A3G9IGR7_9ACTN|nr:hypothetical protein Back2_18230 [Nocardioides baekrokdamisoli]
MSKGPQISLKTPPATESFDLTPPATHRHLTEEEEQRVGSDLVLQLSFHSAAGTTSHRTYHTVDGARAAIRRARAAGTRVYPLACLQIPTHLTLAP